MTDTITLPRSVIEQAIESLQGYARETGDTQPCDAEKALSAALVVAYDALKDAQRYRWLRDRSWRDTTVCVVANPKNSVKLGSFCPSHDLLDDAIDEAMGGAA